MADETIGVNSIEDNQDGARKDRKKHHWIRYRVERRLHHTNELLSRKDGESFDIDKHEAVETASYLRVGNDIQNQSDCCKQTAFGYITIAPRRALNTVLSS